MDLQGNLRKPVVEFGLRETARLLTVFEWGLGGSHKLFEEELRARKCVKSPTGGPLNPNHRLPG